MSGFLILLHAHDHVWRWKQIPLDERAATCQLLAEQVILVLRKDGTG